MPESEQQGSSVKARSAGEVLEDLSLGSGPAYASITMEDLQRVLASLPDIVWNAEINAEGIFRYRFISPAVEQLTGYEQERFLNGPEFWVSLILEEDLHLLQTGVEEILSAERKHHEFEYRIRHKNGQVLWVRDCTSVERLPNGTLVIDGVISNITERKELEEQLRSTHLELDERVRDRTADLNASEQLFRQLTDSITEVFWLSSTDKSKMFYISPAYETIFQRSCQSLYDQPRSFLDAIHPEDKERVKEALPKQIDNNFDVEYRVVRADETIRWVRSRSFPVLNAEGEIYRIAGLVQDITERHQAAETLRENEELYRTLLDRHVDGVALIVDNKIMYVNAAMCEIIGYSEQELLQRDPYQLVQPEDLPLILSRREQLFAGGPESVNEYSYRHPEKGMRRLEVRTRVIQYLGQKSLLTFMRDVTELRANEDTIRFLAMIVRHSQDAIVGTGLDGTVVSWNPAAERMFGYPAEEVVGKSVSMLIPSDRLHELPAALERVQQGDAAHNIITKRTHRSGRLLDVSLTVSSVLNARGEIAGASGIIRDITEQMKVEHAKKVSEAMCESLVSTAPDIILIMDVDGTIRYINRVALDTKAESVIGRNTIEFLHPDFHKTVLEALRTVWDTGEPVTREVIGLGEDGSWRWYESRHGALRQDGQVTGVTVISTDITDKKLEQQKQAAEDQMIRDLLKQRERERKLIAHEVHDGFMQDIVGAQLILQSMLHTARTQNSPNLPGLETIDHALSKAVNEGRRLISELGPLILEHEGLVDALYNHIEQEFSGGSLEVDFQPDLDDSNYAPLVKGTIFRIVQESLTNVLRHSHATTVTITLAERNERLHVEVWDDGIGFKPAEVPAGRFGLQGIRQRARLFGGHAEIISAPGKGTRVQVNLPVIEDHPLGKERE